MNVEELRKEIEKQIELLETAYDNLPAYENVSDEKKRIDILGKATAYKGGIGAFMWILARLEKE